MKYLVILFFILSLLLACTATPQANKQPHESKITDPKLTDTPYNDETYLGTVEEKQDIAPQAKKNEEKEGGKKGLPDYTTDDSAIRGTTTTDATPDTDTGKSSATETAHKKARSSGLTAGYADDNRQFNYFLSFLDKYKTRVEHVRIPVEERIILNIKDKDARSLPNALIKIWAGSTLICTGNSYSDGSFTFYPLIYDSRAKPGEIRQARYKAQITFNGLTQELIFERTGSRSVDVIFDMHRPVYKNIALDMVFIMDTTGSMGEEIERLKATIEIINLNLSSLATRPALRFGMVLYKDRQDDEYVTKTIPLTADLGLFQRQLAGVTAEGGGDRPEDLQTALEVAVKNIAWNEDGVRLAFIITDAPPHIFTYDTAFTYKEAGLAAKAKAIKLFSVGTGGLDLAGEYVLRQISQLTQAKYIFLTRGETGESEGGKEGSVSHHTGSNFQTDKLETIIMQQAREELAHLLEKPSTVRDEDYFVAVKIPEENKQATLKELFDRVLEQLVDYASYKLAPATPTTLIPFAVPDVKTDNSTLVALQPASGLQLNAEYFMEEALQALVRNPAFKAVDRQNLQAILKELELQLAGLSDETQAARVGQVLGAKLLITGTLYQKDKNYELFLRLLNVETAEIIAVTKAQIDARLGL